MQSHHHRPRSRSSILLLLPALATLPAALGCTASERLFYGDPDKAVVHEHDRFGGGDSIKVDLDTLNQLNPNARNAKLDARWDTKSPEVWLTVELDPLSSSGWLYAKCHTFDLLADGKPVPHGEVRYAMDLRGMSPHETVSVPIAVADARALVSVTKLEGRSARTSSRCGTCRSVASRPSRASYGDAQPKWWAETRTPMTVPL
ncbi:MAG: hypothetical protein QM820_30300 [Minicystis sp.]